MSGLMLCGHCESIMVPREIGGWSRTCTCKTGRYWYSAPPTAEDAKAYRQLTGRSVPTIGGGEQTKQWRYG